jgi:hypothetical protein
MHSEPPHWMNVNGQFRASTVLTPESRGSMDPIVCQTFISTQPCVLAVVSSSIAMETPTAAHLLTHALRLLYDGMLSGRLLLL